MPICGIYKITNKINNLVYIGQSVDIFSRWRFHAKAKDNLKIHQAIQQYKITNFMFEIIEQCPKEELDKQEIYWINYYNSYNNGYNMTPGGKTAIISTKNGKPVAQYTLSGMLIDTYNSVKEAQEKTGIAQISGCCRGERKTAGNFQWQYYESFPEQQIRCIEAPILTQMVTQYSMNGEKIQDFNSISDAARAVHISPSSINIVCHNKGYSAGGYRWSYFGKPLIKSFPKSGSKKSVLQFGLNGQFIKRYDSISDAARAVNASPSGISSVCKGTQKTCKKFIWKYEKD